MVYKFSIAIFIIVLLGSCDSNKENELLVVDGVADLRKTDFASSSVIPLVGSWEFYPRELVEPNDISKHTPIFDIQPDTWKGKQGKNGEIYSRNGYGTYRIRILLSEDQVGRRFEFIIPEISSAYNLYVNGDLVVQQGNVDSQYRNTIPYIKPRLLQVKGLEVLDLVFHISNYGYNDGGFWSEVKFGWEEPTSRNYFFGIMREMFLTGAILIMGLYHVGFYFFRRQEKSILYFSIFCFLIAIRTIVTGNRVLLDILPSIPWDLFYRLDYMSFYLAPIPFFLFVKTLYESMTYHYLNQVIILATLAFTPVLLFPIHFFTQTLKYFHILTLVIVIYIFIVVIRANFHKKQGARTFLFGWLALASTVTYDIMIGILNISTTYISSYGFIAFIFSKSLILSARFSKAFKASEELSEELTLYKQSLEEMVEKRTQDISFLNQIAKEVNSSFDLDSIVKQVYKYIKESFGVESIWVLTVDRKEKVLRTSQWIGCEFLTLEQIKLLESLDIPLTKEGGTLYRTYSKKKIFYLPRLNPDLVSGYDRIIIELLRLKSLIQIPLSVHGNVIAILSATSYENSLHLNKSQLTTLVSISEQIAGAVHNSILLNQAIEAKKEVEKAYKESESLAEITKKISSNSSIEDIFNEVESYLKENYGLNYHWLLLVDKESNELYTSVFQDYNLTGPAIREKYLKIRIPLNESSGSLFGTFRRKKVFFLPKIPKVRIIGYDRTIIDDLKLKSLLQVPILMKDEVVGILLSTNLNEHITLIQSELIRISRFAAQIGGAIHNTELLEEAEKEREKADNLLMNILPKNIAYELKDNGKVLPIQHESVTILFTDFQGFTRIAETMQPQELINQLEGAFLQFDEIMERFRMEKLKTIGDSYMCAGGIPINNSTHPFDACLAAIEIQSFMNQAKKMREMLKLPTWQLRVGIHTGPVIAGVIGKNKFAYDIWGDTVNIASRMEASGTVGKINISEKTYSIIKDFFVTEPRGNMQVKGKGDMGMYYLLSIRPEYSIKGAGTSPNSEFYNALDSHLKSLESSRG